ncbi:MAG: response regulator [Ginsengibacter sp.]
MPRVLIIDDDKDFLTIVKSFLEKKDFEVAVYSEWKAASECIINFNPQIILIDVFLSGVDGLEACKKLKANSYTRHIPVIVFSAYPQIGETAIDEFGADAFLSKPFEINELIKKIHKVLIRNHESL